MPLTVLSFSLLSTADMFCIRGQNWGSGSKSWQVSSDELTPAEVGKLKSEDSRLRTRLRRAKEDRERLDIARAGERQKRHAAARPG